MLGAGQLGQPEGVARLNWAEQSGQRSMAASLPTWACNDKIIVS